MSPEYSGEPRNVDLPIQDADRPVQDIDRPMEDSDLSIDRSRPAEK
jgi:hypothetical protein